MKDVSEPDICGYCNYDARGLERCPECGHESRLGRQRRLARLRDEWPADSLLPRVPGPTEQPVVIAKTDDQRAASLLAQHLEVRGITAVADDPQKDYGRVAFSVRPSCYLRVWTADVEQARAIVQKLWPEALWSADSDKTVQ